MIVTKISGNAIVPRPVLDSAIDWASQKLKFGHYKVPVEIEVRLKRNLFKIEKCKGQVLLDDDTRRPRFFDIELDNGLGFKSLLVALMHELVHVAQLASGRWYNDGLIQVWHGKRVDIRKLKYEQYPWEIEAYALEYKLAEEFLELYNSESYIIEYA